MLRNILYLLFTGTVLAIAMPPEPEFVQSIAVSAAPAIARQSAVDGMPPKRTRSAMCGNRIAGLSDGETTLRADNCLIDAKSTRIGDRQSKPASPLARTTAQTRAPSKPAVR